MACYTMEHTIKSTIGCKKPIHSNRRVYRTMGEVKRRIRALCNEWGEENVYQMHPKYEPDTVVVFVRID